MKELRAAIFNTMNIFRILNLRHNVLNIQTYILYIDIHIYTLVTNLASAVFIPQEVKDLVVRIGEPSGGNGAENEAVGLAGPGDLPGGDSHSVIRGVR